MLTAQTQYSLGNARSYFAEPLAVGDHDAKGQTVIRQISVSEVKNPEAATPGHAATQPKSSKEP